MNKLTKENLFKPALSRGESKARNTDEAFRAIVEGETAARERKTAKLKEMRLARQLAEGAQEQAKPRRRAARG